MTSTTNNNDIEFPSWVEPSNEEMVRIKADVGFSNLSKHPVQVRVCGWCKHRNNLLRKMCVECGYLIKQEEYDGVMDDRTEDVGSTRVNELEKRMQLERCAAMMGGGELTIEQAETMEVEELQAIVNGHYVGEDFEGEFDGDQDFFGSTQLQPGRRGIIKGDSDQKYRGGD